MPEGRSLESDLSQVNAATWQLEHSVEAAASRDFAWAYMSDISNWDDPPAQFRLGGAFATGVRGTTEVPGQTRQWILLEVKPSESYTIEMALDGAAISFEWQFSALNERRTRLTQRIALTGAAASNYLEDIRRAFALNVAPGMNKIARAMERAFIARLER
jgi:hypothetical protein